MAKKKKSSGPGPIKEFITTMLEPDENGKLKKPSEGQRKSLTTLIFNA